MITPQEALNLDFIYVNRKRTKLTGLFSVTTQVARMASFIISHALISNACQITAQQHGFVRPVKKALLKMDKC